MNHTHHLFKPAFRVVALLACVSVLVLWFAGCGDERKAPLQSNVPAETETVPLWDHAAAGDNAVVSAGFTVRDTLAPINNPVNDTPARLRMVVYIKSDCQILRREHIVGTEIPFQSDSVIIPALVGIQAVKGGLDSAGKAQIDAVDLLQNQYVNHANWSVDYTDSSTSYGGLPCDTALYAFVLDTTSTILDSLMALREGLLAGLPPAITQFEDIVLTSRLDTLVLGAERDWLGSVLDNRYTLGLWMDNDTVAATYPLAVYQPSGRLTGQGIYLAATDRDPGAPDSSYKPWGFEIALNRFNAADPNNPSSPIEVNWTTCFLGSSRPCLAPGNHNFFARVSGGSPDSRITGILVLVYKRPTP